MTSKLTGHADIEAIDFQNFSYSAITTKSKIFDPLFLDDPVGWLLQFFIGRKNMY